MDARGNKLSSSKIADQNLKKKLLKCCEKVLWEELKSYRTPFGPKLLFII